MKQIESSESQPKQSFIDHLIELRLRLMYSLYAIVAGAIICYTQSEKLFNVVREPIAPYLPSGGLTFTAPADKFIAHLKLSFFSGIVFSSPIWLYQIWKFIAPALYTREKKYSAGFIMVGTLLFGAGVAFAYFGALPAAFKFLMGFGGDVDKPMITIDHYLSFVMITCVMFGLVFEMPLVLVILGMIGLVSQEFLRKNRKIAILILSIVAAVITPGPDVLSMLMMFLPLVVMYEISILAIGFFAKKPEDEIIQT